MTRVHIPTKRLRLRGLVAGVLLVGAWLIWTPSPGAAPRPVLEDTSEPAVQPVAATVLPEAPVIVLYGDSLVEDSRARIISSLTAAYPDANVVMRAFGGSALCDWLESMERDTALHADLAVIEFSGNASTPCMAGRADTVGDLAASYRDDAARAVDIIRGDAASSTKVVFVATPPSVSGPPGPHPLDAGYRAVASQSDRAVTFDMGPQRALALADPARGGRAVFPSAMPCLLNERGLSDCVDGQIEVRNPDGLHFCPVERRPSEPCAVYSSGVVRFGDAVASAAVNALDASPRPVIK